MCAPSGHPDCHCPFDNGAPGMFTGTMGDTVAPPRFVQAITMAAPIKGTVEGGYLVPVSQPGQMMTPMNGGTIALYQDLYGSNQPNGFMVYPGPWGSVFAAGRP